jgi:hypothetical protein
VVSQQMFITHDSAQPDAAFLQRFQSKREPCPLTRGGNLLLGV